MEEGEKNNRKIRKKECTYGIDRRMEKGASSWNFYWVVTPSKFSSSLQGVFRTGLIIPIHEKEDSKRENSKRRRKIESDYTH